MPVGDDLDFALSYPLGQPSLSVGDIVQVVGSTSDGCYAVANVGFQKIKVDYLRSPGNPPALEVVSIG